MAQLRRSFDRSSGALFNLRYGLFLRFMLNPKEINITPKEPTYQVDQKPGLDAPWIHWVSGGEYNISFELFFDRTNAADNLGVLNTAFPLVGLMDVEAVIHAFLRPAVELQTEGARGLAAILGRQTQKVFVPPPDCYFTYGLRWFRCKMMSANFAETVHGALLEPRQLTIPIKLLVLESGETYKIEETQRKALAILGGLSTSGLGTNVINDVVGSFRGVFT